MNKIDFTQVVTDPYDEPIMLSEHKPLTLGRACVTALSEGVFSQEDKQDKGDDKFERFTLACSIAEAEKSSTPTVLTAKQITTIKERLAKVYINTAVMGRCWLMIEPPTSEE